MPVDELDFRWPATSETQRDVQWDTMIDESRGRPGFGFCVCPARLSSRKVERNLRCLPVGKQPVGKGGAGNGGV